MQLVIEDQDLQKRMSLDELLSSKGYRLLLEDVNNAATYSQIQVDNHMTHGAIGPEDLQILNYNLGHRAGLEMVLNILRGYEDELAESKA